MTTNLLANWAEAHLTEKPLSIIPLPSGWSARLIYRVTTPTTSLILVDSSAELIELKYFVAIDQALANQQVNVPEIIVVDFDLGYLLETDFGDISLFSKLNRQNCDRWYRQAVIELQGIQQCHSVAGYALSSFDAAACRFEWKLFTEYYLQARHNVDLEKYRSRLGRIWLLLFENMREQPQVFVHRDYHSQNLMVISPSNDLDTTKNFQYQQLGIIDFQGAKWGPITYDLVSLLKDCYIDWPSEQVRAWVKEFQPLLWQATDLPPAHEKQFQRWFDLTGLQRHLKVLGQMARNIAKDPNFPNAKDLPRVENYVLDVCAYYPELHELGELLGQLINKCRSAYGTQCQTEKI